MQLFSAADFTGSAGFFVAHNYYEFPCLLIQVTVK
jgi:hypothetical protein